jgi:integrase
LYDVRVLSAEQSATLVETVRGTRHEALYAVAVWLGPRQGELAALTLEDVDLDGRTLRVWRSVNTDRAGERWSSTKTGAEREIVLPEHIAASLSRHRKIQTEEKLAAGGTWKNPDLVFANTLGGVNRRATLYENFQRHLKRAGLPRIRFHDLRDTAGTLMIRAGVDIRTVADILGHADPAMTLRRYAHVLPDMRERAAKLIDSYAL